MQWLRYHRELILEILKPARMKSLAQGVSHYKPAERRLSHDGKGFWEDSPPKRGSVAPLLLCCALSICLHSLLFIHLPLAQPFPLACPFGTRVILLPWSTWFQRQLQFLPALYPYTWGCLALCYQHPKKRSVDCLSSGSLESWSTSRSYLIYSSFNSIY